MTKEHCEMDESDIRMNTILQGISCGVPEAGFMTNPETSKRQSFIEINGEKVVCLAKGGECRHNSKYYGFEISWKTPIIEETCPDKCPYKVLVCDEHPNGGCESSVTYYPQHNKYAGQFNRYCKELARLEK